MADDHLIKLQETIIAVYVDAGWMLVERCVPGCCLVDLSDETQTIAIAVSVMHRL